MIKVIVFDCFGVLTTDTWLAFIDSLPLEVDISRARELNHQYDSGLIDKQTFLAEVQDLTGHRPEQVEEMLASEVTKNEILLNYIKGLKKNYKIGLLSNVANNWIRESFLTAEEQRIFDEMIFSYEVGMVKPDPRMFKLVCERFDVEPSQVVLIDDIDRYCHAAMAEGLYAVVYKDFKQMESELETILTDNST